MEWYYIVLICLGTLAVWIALSALLYRPFFKRFYDFTLSLLALIALSPVLLLLTVIGAIVMRGNPFFVQPRPGRVGKKTGQEKIFPLVKFRTMTNAKDKSGNLLPDEDRLTKYGKFLRVTSLDELPELFDILVGHMSIIGPRPLLVQYLPAYTEKERLRHTVRPGLTGLAQVNGRNYLPWDERLAFDVVYVQKITLWSDMAILFKTVLNVLRHKDVAIDTAAIDEGFLDEIRGVHK